METPSEIKGLSNGKSLEISGKTLETIFQTINVFIQLLTSKLMIPKAIREILNDHKTDIESLKSKISNYESLIKDMEKNHKNLQENHKKLLEKTLEISGNWKTEIPNTSQPPIPHNYTPISRPEPIANIKPSMFRMSDLQFLILLKQGKADSTHFAVSPMQLKLAYGLNKSERTVRNKLIELEYRGFVSTTGSRPRKYYLTKAGAELLDQQRRDSISFEL